MIASLRAEVFKIRKRPAIWLVGTVWLVLSLVFGYLFPYLSYQGLSSGPTYGSSAATATRTLATALPGSLPATAIQGFPLFAGALALIIGVLCAGSEYTWQTTKVVLTQRPGRLSVLAGKVAALVLLMSLLVLGTVLVDAVAAWMVAAVENQPADWPDASELGRGFLAGWLVVTMWAVLGAFLSIAVRGTALAIGLGLVWTLAVENLIRLFASSVSAIDVLQRWLPGTNAGSLAGAVAVAVRGNVGSTPGVTTIVSGGQAVVMLFGYLAVLVALASVLLKRRDVA